MKSARLKSAGFWVGLVIFVYALILIIKAKDYAYGSSYGPGPGFFPIWINGILLLLSGAYMVTSLVQCKELLNEILPKGKELRNALEIVGSLLIFIVLAPIFGYIIGSIAMLLPMLIGKFKWYTSILFAVVCSLIIYAVFHAVLNIQLPAGFWGF